MSALLFQTFTAGQDIIAPKELFEFGDFTLYVPSKVSTLRGIVVALGGPDTRAFGSGGRFGAPSPELEASLHILGQELRTLAADQRLAILGTSLSGAKVTGMPNRPESDELILKAIRETAAKSGHPELASAPLFLYGISGGGPEASGFTARNPGRVVGFFLKSPKHVESLSGAEVLAVPTYIVLAERETLTDNVQQVATFKANRQAGGLWALAVEPGVTHHTLTPGQRAMTINWMRAIVELRFGNTSADPLRPIAESSGWLGDPTTGVAQWASYPGDRKSASWFPTQATAEEWKAFVGLPRGSMMLDRNAHLRTGNINPTHLRFRPNELTKRSGQGETRMYVD